MIKLKNLDNEYPSNTGHKWTDNDEKILLDKLNDNIDIKIIAQLLNRSVCSINCRRKEIAYKMHLKNISIEEIIEKTKLDKNYITYIIEKKQNYVSKKEKITEPINLNSKDEILEMKKDIKKLKNTIYIGDKNFLQILMLPITYQEKIIKDIEKIKTELSSYSKLIQVQIDSLNQLVKNITINSNDDYNNVNIDTYNGYSSVCSDVCSLSESDIDEDNKYNIVSIKNIDYIEEDGNYYSIDTSGKKDCLCYITDANGKIKKYKDKNFIIKEPVMTMLSKSSGINN